MKSKKLRSKKIKHPRFARPNVGRPDRKRLKDVWRKPRGIDNKQREKQVHMGAHPGVGYRSPKAIRYLHPSGYKEVLVRRWNDLELIAKKSEIAVRLAASIGRRRRISFVKKINDLGLKLLN